MMCDTHDFETLRAAAASMDVDRLQRAASTHANTQSHHADVLAVGTASRSPIGGTQLSRRMALARGASLAGLYGGAALAYDSPNTLVSSASDMGATVVSADLEEAAPPSAQAAAPLSPVKEISAFDFDVPFRGEPRDIKPFLGRATVAVNVKYDDPETLLQMPGLQDLVERYGARGLHVLAFPTDQGWFEADDSNTLRLKCKSVFNFGQYPKAVVFDKTDLLGGNALPLYTWLTTKLANPWGVQRLVFNYEKFLLDAQGLPLRRYPRKYPVQLMDADVQAVLDGQPLPPPSEKLLKAWEDAKREAIKSEYAFKPGLNVYASGSPAS